MERLRLFVKPMEDTENAEFPIKEHIDSKIDLPMEVKNNLEGLLYLYPDILSLVLYGSRVTGSARSNSDINLYLNAEANLDEILCMLEAISDDIPVNVVTYKDVVDNESLATHIQLHGVDLIKHFNSD